MDHPSFRLAADTDADELFETKARMLPAQAEAHRDIVRSLTHNDS